MLYFLQLNGKYRAHRLGILWAHKIIRFDHNNTYKYEYLIAKESFPLNNYFIGKINNNSKNQHVQKRYYFKLLNFIKNLFETYNFNLNRLEKFIINKYIELSQLFTEFKKFLYRNSFSHQKVLFLNIFLYINSLKSFFLILEFSNVKNVILSKIFFAFSKSFYLIKKEEENSFLDTIASPYFFSSNGKHRNVLFKFNDKINNISSNLPNQEISSNNKKRENNSSVKNFNKYQKNLMSTATVTDDSEEEMEIENQIVEFFVSKKIKYFKGNNIIQSSKAPNKIVEDESHINNNSELNEHSRIDIPDWTSISDSVNGRNKLAHVWEALGLKRTAKYIKDKSFSSISTVKILYERLIFLLKENPNFPVENIDQQNDLKEELRDNEDLEWVKEIDILINKETHFMLCEGVKHLHLDEFGSLLFEIINPRDLSREFPIRSIGASRFIIGWNNPPSLELLNRKLKNFTTTTIPYMKAMELINQTNEPTSGIIYFLNGKEVTYEEVQEVITTMKHDIKQLIRRVHVKKNMIIFFVPTSKLHFLLDNVRYIIIKENTFKSTCNLAPEYYNNIGKLMIENCPCDKPITVEGFLNKHCGIDTDNLVRINQIKKPNIQAKGKRTYTYLVWIRGKRNIRNLLLSIIDFVNDKKRVGYAKWPKSKGEETNSVNISILE